MTDIHFFTANGRETTEGADDSVIQYTEAEATRLGLTFKPVKSDATEPDRAEWKRLADLDGSEPAKKVKPVATPEPTTLRVSPRKAK